MKVLPASLDQSCDPLDPILNGIGEVQEAADLVMLPSQQG